MSAQSQSSAKVAARFCASCAVTLTCWAIWILLSISLGTLIYVVTAKELPVPGFVLRRIESELAKADLGITFGRARLDPRGKILLNDVQLHARRYGEPLISSRLVLIERSFWSILAGEPIPDLVRLEGATVQLPAMLSPSGIAEPLLRDVALNLTHENNLWHIHQFTARLGKLTLIAQGNFLSERTSVHHSITLNEITLRALQAARQLATEMYRFDAFESPVLALALEHHADRGNEVHAVFSARSAQQPYGQPLLLGPLVAAFSGKLDRSRPHALQLHIATRSAIYQGVYSAENLRARLNLRFNPADLSWKPLSALVAGGAATVRGEKITGPTLEAELSDWPNPRVKIAAQIRGDVLAAEIDARLKDQTARVHAEGVASHEVICRVLEDITPRAAPYFVFGDPVKFAADLVLDPGWKFASLRSRVEGGRLNSRDVMITELRGRIDIDGTNFLAHDAILRLNENYARGSYWMDFATTDYRMLLEGQLRPAVINGWFKGDWWLNFWNNNFDFSAAVPQVEVDVQGRWKEAARTQYFGRAGATRAKLLGADFSDVRTLIFLRPNFTDALEISGQRAGGQQELSGSFQRFTDPATLDTNKVTFTLDSSVDADTYLKMTRGKAAMVLDLLQFNRPPRVQAEGSVDGSWPGAVPHVKFNGRAANGLHFADYPVETVQVTGELHGDNLRLADIQAAGAGGRVTGNATMNGTGDARRLAFDLHLKGADLAATIHSTLEFLARRSDGKEKPMADSELIKRAAGGKLDFSLAAQGSPADFASFKGTGSTALTGANLGQIHLFGLLSQALSGLSLNFSSLKLDTARSSLHLDRGVLNFPDVRISGSGAVIDAHGTYTFDDNALDFTAKLKPFEENRNILTAAIGLVVNPITGIFELRLTGPLSKPDWRVSVGQSSPKPETPVAPLPPAEQPAASKGKSPSTPMN